MKLNNIFHHPDVTPVRDEYYPHKVEVDANKKKRFVGLDMENPKVFDLGTANPDDEMGYARYCEQYRGSQNEDTSGYVNVDPLDVAQRAIDIHAAATAAQNQ